MKAKCKNISEYKNHLISETNSTKKSGKVNKSVDQITSWETLCYTTPYSTLRVQQWPRVCHCCLRSREITDKKDKLTKLVDR